MYWSIIMYIVINFVIFGSFSLLDVDIFVAIILEIFIINYQQRGRKKVYVNA